MSTKTPRGKLSPRRSSPKKPARPTPIAIPERGLKIGEAASALGIEAYVLRFWETQFPFLKPKHSRSKHRFYHERDLEVLRLIKRLLHQEGFTIAGANRHIREHGLEALLSGKRIERPAPPIAAAEGVAPQSPVDNSARRVLSEVRRDLQTIHRLLEN